MERTVTSPDSGGEESQYQYEQVPEQVSEASEEPEEEDPFGYARLPFNSEE